VTRRLRWLAVPLLLGLPPAAPRLFAQGFNAEAEARFSVGLSHLREGRFDMAIETIKQAIKSDPKNPFFYKGLGTAYAAKLKWPEAIEAYKRALELNPYYVDVKNDLGAAYMLSGRRDEGKKEFMALFSDPQNPTPEITARNLGQAYLEEKNYPEALNWFKTATLRSKDYPDAYLGAADALLGMGRLEDAILNLEAGYKEIPEDPQVNLALGQVYFKAGRFSESREKLEAAARRDPAGAAGRKAAELLKTFPK
jgi:tetratricopeptide (TPR) repeat protein